MRVLLVEDDRKLLSFLHRAFSEEGDVVDACRDGREAAFQAAALSYDLIVLDWMLPGQDGLSVCRDLRSAGNRTPILLLTARGEVAEKVAALDAGADDYVTKPFHLDEFLARARAVARRARADDVLRVGPFVLDERKRVATVSGARVELTTREFALLILLARKGGRVVTRTEILSNLWGTHHDPESNVVDVHVRNLREKLGVASRLLETVRGQGYRLVSKEPP